MFVGRRGRRGWRPLVVSAAVLTAFACFTASFSNLSNNALTTLADNFFENLTALQYLCVPAAGRACRRCLTLPTPRPWSFCHNTHDFCITLCSLLSPV